MDRSGAMNSNGGACRNTGQQCLSANSQPCDASISNSMMENFGRGVLATSSPHDQTDAFMPSNRGTRIIKRTRVTRTSSDPEDPELQMNSLFAESPEINFKSQSGSPESHPCEDYHSFPTQQSIPPMSKNLHAKNYDDRSAPAMIRTCRAPPESAPLPPSSYETSYKSHGSSSPGTRQPFHGYQDSTPPMNRTPLPDSLLQTPPRRYPPQQHHNPNENTSMSYNSMRPSPRCQFSTEYSPYGRSFDPGRGPRIDPRMKNQYAPGTINTSQMYPSGYGPRGNDSASAAVRRSYGPVRSLDPRLQNQSTPGAMPLSARGGRIGTGSTCQNVTCSSRTGGSLSGYDASAGSPHEASLLSPMQPRIPTPRRYPAAIPWSPRQIPKFSDPVSTPTGSPSYYTSEGSGIGQSLNVSKPWSPQQAGQFSYSSPSHEASYYTTDGSGSGRTPVSSFPFSPRPASNLTGYSVPDNSNYTCSSQDVYSGGNYTDYHTPKRRHPAAQRVAEREPSHYSADMSGVAPPTPEMQSLQRSMDRPNVSGRSHSSPPTASRDYFALIADGSLTPTSKKKKVVRDTTSAGSIVSEECEEIYDIEGDIPMTPTSHQANLFNPNFTSSPYNKSNNDDICVNFFNPPFNSTINNNSGIQPAVPGRSYYVGQRDRPQQRENQSSTIDDSNFSMGQFGGYPNRPGTSSPQNRSGIPLGSIAPEMAGFVGRGDPLSQRGDKSSTINDSDFGTFSSGGGSGKKSPCGCKKKGGNKKSLRQSSDQTSKCENVGTPCKENKSHLSNRSGDGGAGTAATNEPVNVFLADRFDIAAEANATHSVMPPTESQNCICIGAGGNISLDLERIEQEEFSQLSRNLSQWQQSRRKVVSKIDSFVGTKSDPASCEANCAMPKNSAI